ncbi:ABC transporter permease [Dactylosporangium vinaceum]|uniref:ABC transporter permease n=1 Tax=Dactylosporangium vinaceum TaxID=53362 RepID=A0ABV5M693_9ACTN|nr:ABC transporter permease [Dactylosporangium vinaceum]UAB97789.1 ABC transporter permease [Dactylosporangium vinaceum]
MTRLIKAELIKLRTTNMWWIFLICSVAFVGLALLINTAQAHSQLHIPEWADEPPRPGMSEEDKAAFLADQQHEKDQIAQARTAAGVAKIAANIYTSGQFFGLMMVMLLAILLITNEFYHQTATATFLATPKRTKVIVAKLITGAAMAFGFWLLATVINLIAGAIFFSAEGVGNALGQWDAQQAILLNLLVYALWAVFGIGIGVLLRSQIGATITAATVYTIGTYAALIVLALIREYLIKDDWVLQAAVYIPPLASEHVVGSLQNQMGDTHLPARWIGVVVLVGWALVLGGIGTLITRKRDIA